MSKYDNTALLVGNGQRVSKPILKKLMRQSSFVLAVDGGANLLAKYDLQPNAIIGDFDSAIQSDFSEWPDTQWILAEDQNKNDLEKAVKWAIKNHFTTVHLVSFLGKQVDQTFATFSICRKFCTKLNMQIHTDLEQIFVLSQSRKIKSRINQNISILPLSMVSTISTKNLKYPLNHTTLTAGSQGISNISMSENVFIQVHSGSILIFLKH